MGFIIAFCSFFLIKKNQKIKSTAQQPRSESKAFLG
jgi:hypothetical protein